MFGQELLLAHARIEELLGRYPVRGLKGAVGTQLDQLTLLGGDSGKVDQLDFNSDINFRTYNGREAALPIDQHQLIALVAPRAVHVASAEDDRWADPRGEFLAALNAGPVYALHGRRGLGNAAMPAVNEPLFGDGVAYHIRTGKHDITPYDWARYLDHADRVLRR